MASASLAAWHFDARPAPSPSEERLAARAAPSITAIEAFSF
jgi:hypothetical protein